MLYKFNTALFNIFVYFSLEDNTKAGLMCTSLIKVSGLYLLMYLYTFVFGIEI